jgi:dCMP deaminase
MNVPSGTRYELCRSIHAEQNALLQAAIHGVSILGGTMYITGYPCIICAKLIANSQLSRIVIADDSLKEENSEKVMLESGLKVDIIIGCV